MLEEGIIKKCIEGDRRAQEKLYTFYASRLHGICLRYTTTEFEAEDIFQEAFVKIFRQLANYKMEGSFDGWVRRIVVNTAIDHFKANLKKNNHVHLELLEESNLDQIALPYDMSEEDLVHVLNRLPEGYRMVFNLYAIEGYSHKEIATMLEITEGTSKSQLSKARKHIQSLLHLHGTEHGTGTI